MGVFMKCDAPQDDVWQLKNLRDFAGALSDSDYIEELDKVWKSVEKYASVRKYRGKLHDCWRAARDAIANIEKAAPGEAADTQPKPDQWDEPLDKDEREMIEEEWKA